MNKKLILQVLEGIEELKKQAIRSDKRLENVEREIERNNVTTEQNNNILKGFQSSWKDHDNRINQSSTEIVDLNASLLRVQETLQAGQEEIKEGMKKNEKKMATKLEIAEQNRTIVELFREVEKLKKAS